MDKIDGLKTTINNKKQKFNENVEHIYQMQKKEHDSKILRLEKEVIRIFKKTYKTIYIVKQYRDEYIGDGYYNECDVVLNYFFTENEANDFEKALGIKLETNITILQKSSLELKDSEILSIIDL